MNDSAPILSGLVIYFAGFITILFSIACSYALTDGWNFKGEGKS
ncbi:MAG: hypothetical protein NTX15_03575 [Candidatus Kapabacteria bacterium]|nr:hypothetical protein [Candidatus Kapabacteria bacterium]